MLLQRKENTKKITATFFSGGKKLFANFRFGVVLGNSNPPPPPPRKNEGLVYN
jgi:hypothetical protein